MNLSVRPHFSDDSWIQGGGCHRLPLGPHRPIGNPSNTFNPPSSPTTPSQTLTLSSTSTSALTLCLQRPLILYFNINPSPCCLQRPWKLISTTNISTKIFNANTCEPIRLLPHSFYRWSGCMQIAGLCCFVVWASATTNSLSNTAHIF